MEIAFDIRLDLKNKQAKMSINLTEYTSDLFICTNCKHEAIIFFEADNPSLSGIITEEKILCKFCNEKKHLIYGDLIYRFDWPDPDGKDGSQLQCACITIEEADTCSDCIESHPIEWNKIRCACPKCDEYIEESMVCERFL